MQRILEIVMRVAMAKQPMPTNADMAQMLGNGRQSIAKAFDKLVALRRLRVDVKHGYRRVYVVLKQAITGWGEHRPGHAPFCKHPRGSEIPARPAPARAIGRGEGFALLGVSATDEYAYKSAVFYPKPDLLPARTCQFLNDMDMMCGDRSMPGKSWCSKHHAIIFIS